MNSSVRSPRAAVALRRAAVGSDGGVSPCERPDGPEHGEVIPGGQDRVDPWLGRHTVVFYKAAHGHQSGDRCVVVEPVAGRSPTRRTTPYAALRADRRHVSPVRAAVCLIVYMVCATTMRPRFDEDLTNR